MDEHNIGRERLKLDHAVTRTRVTTTCWLDQTVQRIACSKFSAITLDDFMLTIRDDPYEIIRSDNKVQLPRAIERSSAVDASSFQPPWFST